MQVCVCWFIKEAQKVPLIFFGFVITFFLLYYNKLNLIKQMQKFAKARTGPIRKNIRIYCIIIIHFIPCICFFKSVWFLFFKYSPLNKQRNLCLRSFRSLEPPLTLPVCWLITTARSLCPWPPFQRSKRYDQWAQNLNFFVYEKVN